MKRFCVLSMAIIAALCFLNHHPVKTSAKVETGKFRRSERPVPNRYLVVLNETDANGLEADPAENANSLSAGYSMKVDRLYRSALKGFSVEMTDAEAIRLSEDPGVKFVEEDSIVETQAIQTGATWGISRIDQRAGTIPSDTSYEYASDGTGVNVYIVDTGVWTENPDFNGRAVSGFDSYHDNQPITECNGHGTHVAGIVGSSTFGVAKNSNLISVKVFPCSGAATVSDVISGVDWVTRNATLPAVANMSFTTSRSNALEDSIQTLIDRGVTVAVAAGNYGDNACNYSPSHLPAALTVGSIYYTDERPSATNYGSCLDIFAPGVSITSTWNQPAMPVNTISGTSMASPHVAGVAALYLQSSPSASPAEVSNAVVNGATSGVVTSAGSGSPNLLLYSLLAGGSGGGSSCAGASYEGALNGKGSLEFQSGDQGFYGRNGKYSGQLQFPVGSGFAFALEKKSKLRWSTVALSTATGSVQSINYNGKNGTYRWRVFSQAGSGQYSLCSVTP